MKKFIDDKIAKLLQNAKDELDLCSIEWNDSFYDCYNYTPDFDFNQEDHEKFFFGCMVAIDELSEVLTELRKK